MANHLKMAMVDTIVTLKQHGWSIRRIARELGIDRGTVRRYIRQEQLLPKPPTKAPTGSDGISKSPTNAPIGSQTGKDPPGNRPAGTTSKCEPYRKIIEGKFEQGLSAQRIYQDLIAEYGYTDSYYSVRRFVNRLSGDDRFLPFRRMECAPGDEAQIDFGKGAPVVDSDGRHQRCHVMRIALSHSRKGYSQTALRQTTDDFIRCLENAFWHFGGV